MQEPKFPCKQCGTPIPIVDAKRGKYCPCQKCKSLNVVPRNSDGDTNVPDAARSRSPLSLDLSLIRISFNMAYVVMPSVVHSVFDEMRQSWKDHPSTAAFAPYVFACQSLGYPKISKEDSQKFECEHGSLNSDFDYYLMKHPTISELALEQGVELSSADPLDLHVRQPFFTIVVHNKSNNETQIIVLHESASETRNGTSLRRIIDAQSSGGLGPGPSPTKTEFLQFMKSFVA